MTSESGVAQSTRATAKYCYYSKRAARGQFNHRTTAMVTCCISRSRSLLRSRVGKLGTSVEGLLAAFLMSVAGAAVRAQVKAKHPIQSTNGTASSKPPHR